MLLAEKNKRLWGPVLACLLFLMSACETIPTPEPTASTPSPPQPSPKIFIADKADALFAQTVLRELGYRAGPLDGIWGPRSSTALKLFQADNQLPLSGGRLSNQLLTILQELTAHRREDFEQLAANAGLSDDANPPSNTIEIQLRELEPLSSGPQLIITDRPYHIFSKENPYSDVITLIPRGTGIYIISKQQGWYKIEATTGHRGYITSQYFSN